MPPPVGEDYFREKLRSAALSERYAAAKALRYRGYAGSTAELRQRMQDNDEDIYVQLEAAAALAAQGHEDGWAFMESKLRSSCMTVPLETQLETIIVASEIDNKRSEGLLIHVLQDSSRHEELRAGAAWALGQFATSSSANALVETFNLSSLEIKIEAARALLKISGPQVDHLVNLLKTSPPTRRGGISWVLARTGGFDPSDMVGGTDEDLRKWVSYIIGYGKDKLAPPDIELICKKDPQVYFAASVLWQILESWVYKLNEY